MFSSEISEIFKNIYERMLLFVWPQNTIANSGGEFGTRRDLDRVQSKYFFKRNNFIESNADT